MSYSLFIDDERMPPDDNRDWVIVRSSAAAKSTVEQYGVPEFISFDHDLGGSDTAVLFVDWLIENALDEIDAIDAAGLDVNSDAIKFPRSYAVHSQNPAGAANIDAKMKRFIHYLDKL